jgi:hypothetical protein
MNCELCTFDLDADKLTLLHLAPFVPEDAGIEPRTVATFELAAYLLSKKHR